MNRALESSRRLETLRHQMQAFLNTKRAKLMR